MTFQIKVCGITSPEDALAAADAGADAIGLNFYAASKRYVDVRRAQDIVAGLPAGLIKVGVFVNAEVATIRVAYESASLDLIQLHGDEPPEFLPAITAAGIEAPVMRAFACRGDLSDLATYLARCRQLGHPPQRVLLDAVMPDQRGGTGTTCDWSTAAHYHQLTGAPSLVLAGGLTPDNVAAAIVAVQPAAVDVASGVESSPGRKDKNLVARFVSAARKAFAATTPESPSPIGRPS